MSYASKRPSISKAKRARIFLAHDGICWLCKLKIGADDPYDIDHCVSRELGGSDEDDNLAPAHKDCHKVKTKADVKAIAKSNRIRRNLNPETRKVPKRPLPSRPMTGLNLPPDKMKKALEYDGDISLGTVEFARIKNPIPKRKDPWPKRGFDKRGK